MPDLVDGLIITADDFPPAVSDADDVGIFNFSNTDYQPGPTEVGVVFTAPTSGRVRLTIGGGLRDSGTTDRVFLSPQLFEGTDATGVEVFAPSVTFRGFGSSAANREMQYSSRTSLVEGLTPGSTYYVRCMHTAVPPGSGTPDGQTDIGSREIVVVPVP